MARLKTQEDFLELPHKEAVHALMKARFHRINISKNGDKLNMSKKDSKIDEDMLSIVRDIVKESKEDILGFIDDKELFRGTLAQMRNQFIEYSMLVDELMSDIELGMIVYHWMWEDEGCIMGEEGGCNIPYVMVKCAACARESNDNKENETL